MVYVTADLHGDATRFYSKEIRRLKKGDTLIVLGDFGFLWQGTPKEKKLLKKLGKKRYQILFLDGAHENFDLLEQYPVEEWSGGQVHRIDGSLKHLMRGQVYVIEGKRIFTMGGGESDEKEMRAQQQKWFPQEMPNPQEKEAARKNLERFDWSVDYVLTHDCSEKMKVFLSMGQQNNSLNRFLTEIEGKLQFRKWFFGFYHLDRQIPPRHCAVYRSVQRLD